MVADPAEFSFRRIAVPAYGPTLAAAIGIGAQVPIIALAARELGATVGVAAFAVGLGLIAELFFSLPAGTLVTRIGERRSLIGGAAVEALAAAACWLAPNLAVLMVSLFAMGFTSSVFLLARQGYLIDAVPFSRRARAMSTLGGVHRIGLFLGPVVGTPVVHRWGAQAGFSVAVTAGVVAALIAWLAPDITAAHEALEREGGLRSTRTIVWRHRHVLLTLGLGITAIGSLRTARMTLVPLWAEHVGISAADTSLIFAVAAGIEMLMFYPAGSLMDRRGRVWAAVPCVLIVGLGIVLLPVTASVVAVGAATVVTAIGNGFGSGIVMTLGADTAPEVGRAQFLGAWRFLSAVGGSSTPALIGVLTSVASLAAGCVAIAALAVAGAGWLAHWVPRFDPGRPRQRLLGR